MYTPLSILNGSGIEYERNRFAALDKDSLVNWYSVNLWTYVTPYSPGNSAIFYLGKNGESSPKTQNLLEKKGVTPQSKIVPIATRNIYITYIGQSALQNSSHKVGELL